MGRQIVYYSVLWVSNYKTLRTTVLDVFVVLPEPVWVLVLPVLPLYLLWLLLMLQLD